MPLTDWRIDCGGPDCARVAEYKIAARWSDGTTAELKTYSLSCEACLAELFPIAVAKMRACPKTDGEILDEPHIYRLVRGDRDRTLQPCPELEAGLALPP